MFSQETVRDQSRQPSFSLLRHRDRETETQTERPTKRDRDKKRQGGGGREAGREGERDIR